MPIINTYTYISDEIIHGQMRVVSVLMNNKEYTNAKKILNDILSSTRCAYINDCNKKRLSNIIDETYRTLLDMAFRRYYDAHNRVKDMLWKI